MSKRIIIHLNEDKAEGKIIKVVKGMNIAAFKKEASSKLNIKVKKFFLANGVEINSCDDLEADDLVYCSEGESFFKERPSSGEAAGVETMHLTVLGTGSVGKSCLTLKFVRDVFIEYWDPTIEDAYRKTLEVDSSICQLNVLDTAGQDDFRSLMTQWMTDKDGYIFVYSLDNEKSLDELLPFFEMHEQINESKKVPIILVGNKKDLMSGDKLKEAIDRGKELATKWGARHIEVSALSGENVLETFETFVRNVREARRKKAEPEIPKKKLCTIL